MHFTWVRWAILLLVAMVLSGCWRSVASYEPAVPIHAGNPVVYIHPLSDIGWERRVGVLPFQVPANVGRAQGEGVAALFKDVLLGKRLFKTVELLPYHYGSFAEAVELGRRSRVDFVLAGQINTLLEGGGFGGGRVEVAVRLLSTATGDTIWYMEQAMEQEMDYAGGGMFQRLADLVGDSSERARGGASPALNMLLRVAWDMGDVMGGALP